jgi:4-amino-4-deoxychorismate lyase
VTDPKMMVVPLDDHLVHRGHGVFDTANVADGKVYGLNFHLDRLLLSAERAKIPLPQNGEHHTSHCPVNDRLLCT